LTGTAPTASAVYGGIFSASVAVANGKSTSLYALYTRASSVGVGSSAVINAYSLYVDSVAGSNINNKYGIVQIGTEDINYFGGNTGIGTTAPGSYKLNVLGNALVTGNSYLMGNVGINTISPTSSVEVYQNTNNSATAVYNDNEGLLLSNYNTTVGCYSALRFMPGNAGATLRDMVYISGIYYDNNQIDMAFGLAYSYAQFEIMRLTRNQNVGIGITNPTNKLEVVGGVKATLGITGSNFNSTVGQSVFARNVAIGAASANSPLHVRTINAEIVTTYEVATNANVSNRLVNSNAYNAYYGMSNVGNFAIGDNTSLQTNPTITFTSESRRVGIGMTNPTTDLQV
jgi:hypothetical protein